MFHHILLPHTSAHDSRPIGAVVVLPTAGRGAVLSFEGPEVAEVGLVAEDVLGSLADVV